MHDLPGPVRPDEALRLQHDVDHRRLRNLIRAREPGAVRACIRARPTTTGSWPRTTTEPRWEPTARSRPTASSGSRRASASRSPRHMTLEPPACTSRCHVRFACQQGATRASCSWPSPPGCSARACCPTTLARGQAELRKAGSGVGGCSRFCSNVPHRVSGEPREALEARAAGLCHLGARPGRARRRQRGYQADRLRRGRAQLSLAAAEAGFLSAFESSRIRSSPSEFDDESEPTWSPTCPSSRSRSSPGFACASRSRCCRSPSP